MCKKIVGALTHFCALQRGGLGGDGGVLFGDSGGPVSRTELRPACAAESCISRRQGWPSGQARRRSWRRSAPRWPPGMPLGICTVASSASRPSRAPPFIGDADHRQGGVGGNGTGQMGGHARGRAHDHAETIVRGRDLAKSAAAAGRAVGREDVCFKRDAEILEHRAGQILRPANHCSKTRRRWQLFSW